MRSLVYPRMNGVIIFQSSVDTIDKTEQTGYSITGADEVRILEKEVRKFSSYLTKLIIAIEDEIIALVT